jgi:hypothetical protein
VQSWTAIAVNWLSNNALSVVVGFDDDEQDFLETNTKHQTIRRENMTEP